MLSKGLSEEDLFSFLSSQKKEDIDHTYILSSMCTLPHPVAVKAHCMFMETNLGDPGLFPGLLHSNVFLLNASVYFSIIKRQEDTQLLEVLSRIYRRSGLQRL